MYTCKFCGKEITNSKAVGGHVVQCKLNPNHKKLSEILITNFNKGRIPKIITISKCKNCGIDTENPTFCSKTCAATFNNKKRDKVKSYCQNCNVELTGWRSVRTKYCSRKCEFEVADVIRKEKILLGELSEGASKDYIRSHYDSCSVCGLGTIWNGKPITLQVDHVDGNSDNNKLENLRLICPNCHTQTDTFCQRNHKNTKRNSYLGRYKKKVLNM